MFKGMKMKNNNYPLISVIVPTFKVEMELIANCINSIIKQTYKNIEVIVVDDGNEKDYVEQLKEICSVDNRIRVISHDNNKGLYQARLTGVSESKDADYIMFVDADDEITIDWIRLLVKKAISEKSDIVMGRTISKDQNGWKYIYNANYSICTKKPLLNEEIFEFLVKDCGLDFSIHTVWNKIYSRNLWDRAWEDLNRIKSHLIMTEDIMFSFVLFYHAKKMAFSNHDGYIYYRNSNSSTVSSTSTKKILKNLEDLENVFSTVSEFMSDYELNGKYEKYFSEWKARYYRWWSYNVETACNNTSEEEAELIKQKFFRLFDKNEFQYAREEDSYFDEKKTEWNSELETIKKTIVSDESKVISFDLFDTLIKRPVLEPADVYEVVVSDVDLQGYDEDIIKLYRRLAEEKTREIVSEKYPDFEDVTLDEIYDVMNKEYCVPKELCQHLMKAEEDVEVEFAVTRQLGHDLFDLAVLSGKKVFITSDMYLTMDTIKKILEKNSYVGYEKILLSSEERVLKSTGNLFKRLLEIVSYEPGQIIHIGDNWNADTIIPRNLGIKTFFIPKAKDILLNYLGDKFTGNAVGKAINNNGSIIDYSKYFDSFAMRCMYANIANIMFDDPFVSFNTISDYNGNPYFLGCYALGMHVFGLTKWLNELAIKNKYRAVHFTARDGFYIKRIYDRVNQGIMNKYGKSNYLYMSRKALITADIKTKNDVDKIIQSTNYRANTPMSVINRYSNILKPLTEDIKKQYKDAGFLLSKPFKSERDWVKFILTLKEIQFDEDIARHNRVFGQEYFKKSVKPNDIVFDLGYSGKLHQQLVNSLGFNVDGAYVNFSDYSSLKRNAVNNLGISSYYEFVPSMYGIMNEYILSDRNPSCIGYNEAGPVFENKMDDYIGDYVVNEINRGAYVFTDELMKVWDSRITLLQLQPITSGLLYEKFLGNPTAFDLAIFDYCYIEDEFYGGITKRKIREIWDWQRKDRDLNQPEKKAEKIVKEIQIVEKEKNLIEMQNEVYNTKLFSRSKLTKALYWYCVDRDFLKKRITESVIERDK